MKFKFLYWLTTIIFAISYFVMAHLTSDPILAVLQNVQGNIFLVGAMIVACLPKGGTK